MNLLKFFRANVLRDIDRHRLKEAAKQINLRLHGVMAEYCYYIQLSNKLNPSEEQVLRWILAETFEPNLLRATSHYESVPSRGSLVYPVEVGPRMAVESPWSSNMVSICHAVGLTRVVRVERSIRYKFWLRNSLGDAMRINKFLFDPMTQEIYPENFNNFPEPKDPPATQSISLTNGQLDHFLKECGLSFNQVQLEYIQHHFGQVIKRDPTDVELFMLGQLWSEHCRHGRFNAAFVINNYGMEKTLFQMIQDTYAANPGNVIVAYDDNADVVRGNIGYNLIATNPTGPSVYEMKKIGHHIIFKAESHNHPTAVEAYEGAGTGVGGMLRDLFKTGRGGVPVAGCAIYNMANLNIPGAKHPWEEEYAKHPIRFKTPLEILIQASNGASDYGNQIGFPIIAGSVRSFDLMVANQHIGYRKPVMLAGGIGLINQDHTTKNELKAGYLICHLGGPSYPIGIGGGSASSVDAGSLSEQLDFDSVQRGDGEMGQRLFSVTRACSELGKDNPIESGTDLGAGGFCVAWSELAAEVGARYGLRTVPCKDPSMPSLAIFCNESQERAVVVVKAESLDTLQSICNRNRCPCYVVGEITGDGNFTLTDKNDNPKPVDLSTEFLLQDLPQETVDCRTIDPILPVLKLPERLTLKQALSRVLRLASVGSKEYLTNKVDRSVGGRVVQQQCVGPLQLPLANCGVTSDDWMGKTGAVQAIGEQPIKGIISPEAGSRMSIAESLLNAVWADVGAMGNLSLSGTWQWPCKQPGEDARLYRAVKAASELCIELGVPISVGKDSLSMTMDMEKDGQSHLVKAPGTVQMIAHGSVNDVKKTVTPDIKRPGVSRLLLIDLSKGERRLGGSALAHVYGQVGNQTPDVDTDLLKRGFEAIQQLISHDLILSGHDRSDGGLITCLLEMAFGGNCGINIQLNHKRWSKSALVDLFNEELGVVIEYLPEHFESIKSILCDYHLWQHCCTVGNTTKTKKIRITHQKKLVLSDPFESLLDKWRDTSFRLDARQANPDCVSQERSNIYYRPGPKYEYTLQGVDTGFSTNLQKAPIAAVVREEGTNGDRDLAFAFKSAGFKVKDVHMTDLISGESDLNDVKLLGFPGGFSYRDVGDSAKGWAATWLFNRRVRDQLTAFLDRSDTLSFGVCNGCQLMAMLGIVSRDDLPAEHRPRFIHNVSGRFESRFSTLKVLESNSVFLKGMAGSTLGCWVAHGEGRFHCSDMKTQEWLMTHQAPLRYVDDYGNITAAYPYNPNGSPLGVAGLTSGNGRHLAMMPHPERLVLKRQWPWMPEEWKDMRNSPWRRLFFNAREYYG